MKKVKKSLWLGEVEVKAVAEQARIERRGFADMVRLILENWARKRK